MEDVGRVPTELTSANVEPATIPTVDGWIESLMQCKQLSEGDVQRLCVKVRRFGLGAPLPLPGHLGSPRPVLSPHSLAWIPIYAVESRGPLVLSREVDSRHMLTGIPAHRHARSSKKNQTCNPWYVCPANRGHYQLHLRSQTNAFRNVP
jgi:hypothetical protein